MSKRDLIPFRSTKLAGGGCNLKSVQLRTSGAVHTSIFVTSVSDSSPLSLAVFASEEKDIFPPWHVFSLLYSSTLSKFVFFWCSSFLTVWNTFWLSVHMLRSFFSQPKINHMGRSLTGVVSRLDCPWTWLCEVILLVNWCAVSAHCEWVQTQGGFSVYVLSLLASDRQLCLLNETLSIKNRNRKEVVYLERYCKKSYFIRCIVYFPQFWSLYNTLFPEVLSVISGKPWISWSVVFSL